MNRNGGEPYLTLDAILSEEAARINTRGLDTQYSTDLLMSNCQMQKFALPGSEAKELLRLLAKLDVTATSVYPGYASIKTELEMRTWWL